MPEPHSAGRNASDCTLWRCIVDTATVHHGAPATEDDAEVNAKRTDNSFTTLYTAVHGSATWNGSL